MDSRPDRTVALMAIQPRFVDLILSGVKRVEFRKTRFRNSISHVIIYSSGPISKVVGVFEVNGLDVDDPMELWKRYLGIAGISCEDFDAYYRGRKRGVAIRIGRVFKLEAPVSLDELCGKCYPPQSFEYVKRSVLDELGLSSGSA